jgi:hypothetical protein
MAARRLMAESEGGVMARQRININGENGSISSAKIMWRKRLSA